MKEGEREEKQTDVFAYVCEAGHFFYPCILSVRFFFTHSSRNSSALPACALKNKRERETDTIDTHTVDIWQNRAALKEWRSHECGCGVSALIISDRENGGMQGALATIGEMKICNRQRELKKWGTGRWTWNGSERRGTRGTGSSTCVKN